MGVQSDLPFPYVNDGVIQIASERSVLVIEAA